MLIFLPSLFYICDESKILTHKTDIKSLPYCQYTEEEELHVFKTACLLLLLMLTLLIYLSLDLTIFGCSKMLNTTDKMGLHDMM